MSNVKQGVALSGRNTTGPPSRAAAWWVTLHMRVLQTTTDASGRYKYGPHTLCVVVHTSIYLCLLLTALKMQIYEHPLYCQN